MLVTEQSPTIPTAGKHGANRALRSGRVIGCRVDETTLLIIGLGRVPAGNISVTIGDDQAGKRSAFVSEWRLPAPSPQAKHGFAALLPAGDADTPITTIQFAEEEAGSQFIVASRLVSVGEAAALLVESAGTQSAAIVNRVVDNLMAGNLNRRRLQTITTLLQAAHASDGFVELIGETHDGVTLLQGWNRGMAPSTYRMCAVGSTAPVVAECGIAVFPRAEAPEGASGFIGLLDAGQVTHAPDIEGLVFRGRAGWRHIAVHPKKRIAGPLETPEHIRSVLLRTNGAPEVLLSLRTAANSFEGKETVSGLPHPVRMGIDNIFEADGGNLLASGWLYDPEGHVATVKLRRHNAAATLDECWTRFQRPDVTDSFNEQQPTTPGFWGEQHTHGFIAQAQLPADDPDARLYFELTLRDLRRAFLPVRPARTSARSAALRQLGAIDPANCALPAIIDTQIVPFLGRSGRSAPVIDTVLDAGPFDEENSPPIVIGAGESEEDIAPLMALLALDPETRHAPIVIAMPADRFRRQATRLMERARFYRLSVRLVSVKEPGDVYDMLEAGTLSLTCETVVSLSASLIPRGRGWYGKLVTAAASLKGSIISPVLAYEDHSIRWAGSWIEGDTGDQPVVGRYAGYPLKAITDMKLTRIAAASLECCIMPRDALARVGGFSGGYLGAQEKGLDLGLRLNRSGIGSYLLPSVQMWGCDDARDGHGPAIAALVEEIDRKIFKSQCSPVLAVEKQPEKRSA
ncbi:MULTISPECIES: hypothetical protein [unclassified Rhizobium]|uniref:glycosyltransferase family 2 protein n=1 Tax=unclassified Rhizobium TaxID=2613769 RepID=UPI0006F74F3D|nr:MULTISPECIES: hypothetical protein [unclassified Rhizobium]KQV34934.1 hypothetical protein ASC86_11945 [Rhizobium sp. Root1212]KRD24739.1 hypothetical protein ASE37_11940 [Rhizobium sp. Root268]